MWPNGDGRGQVVKGFGLSRLGAENKVGRLVTGFQGGLQIRAATAGTQVGIQDTNVMPYRLEISRTCGIPSGAEKCEISSR